MMSEECKGSYHWCLSDCRDLLPSHLLALLAAHPHDHTHTLCICLGRYQTERSPHSAMLTSVHQEAAETFVVTSLNCCTAALAWSCQMHDQQFSKDYKKSTAWPGHSLSQCVCYAVTAVSLQEGRGAECVWTSEGHQIFLLSASDCWSLGRPLRVICFIQ